MANNYHIGVDVDGVLRKFLDSVRREMISDFPESEEHFLSPDEIEEWGIKQIVAPGKFRDMIAKYVFENPETSFRCFRNPEPFPGALSSMSSLYSSAKDRGHVVTLCTSQGNPWQREATMEWVHEHNVPFDNIVMTSSGKGLFNLDYHLDDRTKNCLEVDEAGGVGVLMTSPYNDPEPVDHVVTSIREFEDIVVL